MARPESPAKPVLVFDDDCAFCRRWVARWRLMTGERIEYAPAGEAAARFPDLPAQRFARSVVWIGTDGAVAGGAEAVCRVLAEGGSRAGLWAYRRVPGFAWCAERGYAFIAKRRPMAARAAGWLVGDLGTPPAFQISRWLFIRLLGGVYFAAFVSLGTQIQGLAGSRGLVPAAEWLGLWERRDPAGCLWRWPTLLWLDPSDGALELLCGAGAFASLCAAIGFAPAPALLAAWALYLSLFNAVQPFLGFQWDILLLEAGFLAIFLAPPQLLPRLPGRESRVSRSILGLHWWLVFRLMFASGIVKLLSGDVTWWDGTALLYHYETQPLPAWPGWHAHQLPAWFQTFSVGVMFAVEMGAPFLILAPRRLRALGAAAMIGLMGLIAVTGNYCFFNLLTAALCLLLIDDASWPRWLRRRAGGGVPQAGVAPGWSRWTTVPVTAVLLAVGTAEFCEGLTRAGMDLRDGWPAPVARSGWWKRTVEAADAWREPVGGFRLASDYGLFRVMTRERLEIEIEGTPDGREWRPYVFAYKPGDPARAPGFVAPHQPRLDWQMWFAALAPARHPSNWWFHRFWRKLLDGEPAVLDLLERNPFPEKPPILVRATLYRYRFTDPETRRRDGTWWRRERVGPYLPAVGRY